MDYCNAGHNPAILVERDGRVRHLPACGTVLGILPELGYETRSTELAPGELIAIYSDGVTEVTSQGTDEEFGEERLAALLAAHRGRSAEEIVSTVTGALAEWMAGTGAVDDMTLVVARRTA
jgi:sigma-B regulation protein RsbU (phosphoserine phosphatase)